MQYRLLLIAPLMILSLAGCEKRRDDAIVLEKEHIAAAEKTDVTSSSTPDTGIRSMRDDEITVDSYVMKREVRGTSRDPRALKDEQWLVKVRTIRDNRTFGIPAERGQCDRLEVGDRVQISYQVGKYTGTVWGARIVEVEHK